MSVKIQSDESLFALEGRAPEIIAFLEFLPCAIAVWSLDGLIRILNYKTTQLVGFSNDDFRKEPSLWMSRIHPEDRGSFVTTWKKLRCGEKMASCDYRFFPKESQENIWLNDASVSYQFPDNGMAGIASVYTDISELMTLRQMGKGGPQGSLEVIRGLIHEILNNLQLIRGALDVLDLAGAERPQCRVIANGVERTNKLMQELDEYFFRPKGQFSTTDPIVLLEELAERVGNELVRQGVHLTMVRRDYPLPKLQLDLGEMHSALRKVIDFSRALLPQGGELKIEAGLREIDGKRYLELIVSSSGANSIPMEEKNVFRPFLRINGQSVGLSMALAEQILRRHDGKIFFRREDRQRGVFTILIRTHSD